MLEPAASEASNCGCPRDIRAEACAAAWAAIQTTIDASALTPEDRTRLKPITLETLHRHWHQDDPERTPPLETVDARARDYLNLQNADGPWASTNGILDALWERLSLDPAHTWLSKIAVSFQALRMVEELHRLHDAPSS